MRTENVHSLILGAGPAGLAAGYVLAQAGHRPVIVDRENGPGGLMRSVHRGDFVVDVGRKELYNRLEKVDALWGSVIGNDYRPYPHRGAFLYRGHLLEMTRGPKGIRRGMPWPMFFSCAFGFLTARLNVFAGPPRNVEEYFYRSRGRLLTRVASQGFQEKLAGKRWSDMKLPENFRDDGRTGLFKTIKEAGARALSNKQVNTFKGMWRHPAKGTGQICDALARGIEEKGGRFVYGAKIQRIEKSEERVGAVQIEAGGETVVFRPQFLASSVPLEVLIPLLGRKIPESYLAARGSPSQRRTVILVYLFLNQAPKFPQAWLQVTCPTTRIGRITNYEGFNGDMVPPGKGCVCCEYYCYGADPLLALSDADLVRMTSEYCVGAGLIAAGSATDTLVMKLPGADASQNRHNWITSLRLGLLNEVTPYQNLYHIARTDLDIATLAGIEAAEAILSGDRAIFDRHFDPREIGIRSEPKAFEFKLPEGVDTSPSQ